MNGKGKLRVCAVHRAARGEHEVLDPAFFAPFEHVKKAHDVALHIAVRVFKGVAHSRLRCEVHNRVKGAGSKKFFHPFSVLEGHLAKRKILVLFYLLKARLFQADVVVVVEVVDSCDLHTFIEKPSAQVKSDEPGGSCHEHVLHSAPLTKRLFFRSLYLQKMKKLCIFHSRYFIIRTALSVRAPSPGSSASFSRQARGC